MKVSVTNEHEKLLNHVHCLFSHIKLKVFVMNGMGGWKRKLCQLILVFNLILLLVQWFGIQYTYQLISKFHFFRSTKLEYIRIYFEKLLFDSDIYLWFDLKWKVVIIASRPWKIWPLPTGDLLLQCNLLTTCTTTWRGHLVFLCLFWNTSLRILPVLFWLIFVMSQPWRTALSET